MSLFTVAHGVKLGVALRNLKGKSVTVYFGLGDHTDGWLEDKEAEERVRELDQPWKRTITGDKDIDDFCNRACEMGRVIYNECVGRTFYFEGFRVLQTKAASEALALAQEGGEATITLKWGS